MSGLPFEEEGELAFQMPIGGGYLVFGCDATSGVDHVRVVNDDGAELVYWQADEWGEDPEGVMAAIMGALMNGAAGVMARVYPDEAV
jgi:hypothetical protein